MTPQDSSQISVSTDSVSASRVGSVGVGAFVGAFPPLGGVGAEPD